MGRGSDGEGQLRPLLKCCRAQGAGAGPSLQVCPVPLRRKYGKGATLTMCRPGCRFRGLPSFHQETVGSGRPRGGPHSRTIGSPTVATVSCGWVWKSSRRSAGMMVRRQGSLPRCLPRHSPHSALPTFSLPCVHSSEPPTSVLPSPGLPSQTSPQVPSPRASGPTCAPPWTPLPGLTSRRQPSASADHCAQPVAGLAGVDTQVCG